MGMRYVMYSNYTYFFHTLSIFIFICYSYCTNGQEYYYSYFQVLGAMCCILWSWHGSMLNVYILMFTERPHRHLKFENVSLQTKYFASLYQRGNLPKPEARSHMKFYRYRNLFQLYRTLMFVLVMVFFDVVFACWCIGINVVMSLHENEAIDFVPTLLYRS